MRRPADRQTNDEAKPAPSASTDAGKPIMCRRETRLVSPWRLIAVARRRGGGGGGGGAGSDRSPYYIEPRCHRPLVAANAQLKDALVWRVMMIRHRRPPSLCCSRQIDINVIISGGRAVQLAGPLERRNEHCCTCRRCRSHSLHSEAITRCCCCC